MCQLHSVAGTKTLTLFHVFGVEYPSERVGRVGWGEPDQDRQSAEERQSRCF